MEFIDETIRLTGGDGQTRQYAYGGVSYDDAYDSVHRVEYAGYDEVSSLWDRLAGYWNSTDGFVVFERGEDGTPAIAEGIWDAGSGRGFGTFEKAHSTIGYEPGDEIRLVFYYPPIEEEHIDGPQAGLYQLVTLNLSGLERDGKIGVKMGDERQWMELTYGGATSSEAYEAFHGGTF